MDYTDCVWYLSENDACDGVLFDQSKLGQMFYLDTMHCVTGKRKKKYNSFNLYTIFGAYVNKSPQKVKELMLNEIWTNKHWYLLAGQVVYGMKSMNFDQWFKLMKPKKAHADELCIYALSVLFRRHTVVNSSLRPWMTLKLKQGMTSETLFELCETHLLYLGNGAFGELFRKPITSVRPQQIDLDELQNTRHIFRDHNVPFMYLEIPSGLHNETDTDDAITNTTQETGDGESVATDKSVKKEIGQVLFNIFDESYIDWIKQEKEPKKEQEADITQERKMENSNLTVNENVILPQVSVTGSLIDHSLNCQLQLALKDTINDGNTMSVLTCCAQNPALQVAITTNS